MNNANKNIYRFESEEELECLRKAIEKTKKLDLFGHFKKENEQNLKKENKNNVA